MPYGLDALPEIVPTRHMAQGNDSSVGLSLLFHSGERPDADAVADLIGVSRDNGLAASVSHRPKGQAQWLELLASGLTFDLLGLSPGETAGNTQSHPQCFGFDQDAPLERYEALELVPSGHIISGAGLLPVVRTMMGLGANLALGLPVRAVAWGPANTLMEPKYFCRVVLNWLGGGAFPALGLTALVPLRDGGIASRGLAHFTGQEMQLQGQAGEGQADTAKLAVRVIDHFVRHGRISEPVRVDAGAQPLLAEPSQVGKLVLVWREGHD